jgi:hypothetical protein
MKLEYYRGGPVGFGTTTTTGEWVNITTDSPDIQTGGTRGVFIGGRNHNVMDYVTISTTGNAIDFGDSLTQIEGFSLASRTRGVSGGTVSYLNVLEYITISSTGNAQDFGDLTVGRRSGATCSNSTRGIFAGGFEFSSPLYKASNILDYITIASQGNAKDFGDLYLATGNNHGNSIASSTRGIIVGSATGQTPSIGNTNIIQFITISTLGNSANFGESSGVANRGGCSNSIRGVYTINDNTIEYITIATLGNSQNFGDLTISNSYRSAASSSTRGIFGGGYGPSNVNTIDYVQIMSTGNAIDFGDLTDARGLLVSCSNGHGGLG